MRGFLAEARETAERVLALPGSKDVPDVRAAALEAAGGIAYWQADMDATRQWYGEALDLARASGDLPRIANAVYNMAFTYSFTQLNPEDAARAREIATEAVDLYRQLGDEGGTARPVGTLNRRVLFRNYPRSSSWPAGLRNLPARGRPLLTGWAPTCWPAAA
jgi:hypothetical protein